ncbi:MAG: hypothetical protein KJ569_02380, partial [Candidatus Omnitrophica bacterium]|nr:hypothetical protein [Candidatus Omnitrophota bacterium]
MEFHTGFLSLGVKKGKAFGEVLSYCVAALADDLANEQLTVEVLPKFCIPKTHKVIVSIFAKIHSRSKSRKNSAHSSMVSSPVLSARRLEKGASEAKEGWIERKQGQTLNFEFTKGISAASPMKKRYLFPFVSSPSLAKNDFLARLDKVIQRCQDKGIVNEAEKEELIQIMEERWQYYKPFVEAYGKKIEQGLQPFWREPLRRRLFCHRDSREQIHNILLEGLKNWKVYYINICYGRFSYPLRNLKQGIVIPMTTCFKKGWYYDPSGVERFSFSEANVFKGGGYWIAFKKRAKDVRFLFEEYLPLLTQDKISSFLEYIIGNNLWSEHLSKLKRIFLYDQEAVEDLDTILGWLVNTQEGKDFMSLCGFDVERLEKLDLDSLATEGEWFINTESGFKFKGWGIRVELPDKEILVKDFEGESIKFSELIEKLSEGLGKKYQNIGRYTILVNGIDLRFMGGFEADIKDGDRIKIIEGRTSSPIDDVVLRHKADKEMRLPIESTFFKILDQLVQISCKALEIFHFDDDYRGSLWEKIETPFDTFGSAAGNSPLGKSAAVTTTASPVAHHNISKFPFLGIVYFQVRGNSSQKDRGTRPAVYVRFSFQKSSRPFKLKVDYRIELSFISLV